MKGAMQNFFALISFIWIIINNNPIVVASDCRSIDNNQVVKASSDRKALCSAQFTNCGPGKIVSLITSITPDPFIWVPPQTLWFGGRISFTDEARRLVANVTLQEFITDLRIILFIDKASPEILDELLKQTWTNKKNNTKACGPFFTDDICEAIYSGMQIGRLKNVPILFDLDSDIQSNSLASCLISFILELEVNLQIRMQIVLHGNTVLCLKGNLNTTQFNTGIENDNALRRKNVDNYFKTPKYIDFYRNNSLLCPENAKEGNDSTCQCAYPLSGPFCSFQFTYDQFTMPDSCAETGSRYCKFDEDDYINYCSILRNISVIEGLIDVHCTSLKFVEIGFKVINFPTRHFYEISISDKEGIMGTIYNAEFSIGFKTTYNLTALCTKQKKRGIDCRNKMYDSQKCYNCPDLSLKPFTEYYISLQLRGNYDGQDDFGKVFVGTVSFTTPEDAPLAPKIIKADIIEHGNLITIEWIIYQDCPGIIRRYQIDISCSTDHQSFWGNISFDCRLENDQTPRLNATLPEKCKHEKMSVRLSIGTNSSMSPASEPFVINNGNSWPIWVIIVVVIGCFGIAIAIAAISFYFYYKRYVRTPQNLYRTFMTVMDFGRNGSNRLSFQQRDPPIQSAPDLPQYNQDSNNSSVYQTIFTIGEAETPLSVQYVDFKTKADSPHITADIYEEQFFK